jgi:ribosomal protein S18 acetylase RimI-like enzyme
VIRLRIRPARLADAEAIARVHVQAWRETYRGLVPDSVLAGLSVEGRVRAWSDMIGAGDAAPAVFVAEQDGTIVGFASARLMHDPLLATDGEVTSIYLLDVCKRRGIGRLLFRQIVAWLRERDCTSLGLWVLDTNEVARAFYAALGGRTGPRKSGVRKDVTLHEIAYVWDNIGLLVLRDRGTLESSG